MNTAADKELTYKREVWKALNQLESSRLRGMNTPQTRKWLAGATALVLLVGLFYASRVQTPEGFLLALPMIWYIGAVVISMSLAMSVVSTYQTDWWLTIPVPRRTLLLAKWWSSMRGALGFMYVVLVLAAIDYVITFVLKPQVWVPTLPLLHQILFLIVMMMVMLPALAALGAASLGLMSGWKRMFQSLVYLVGYGGIGGIEGLIISLFKTHHGWNPLLILLLVAAVSACLTVILLYAGLRGLPSLGGIVGTDAWKSSNWWRDRGKSLPVGTRAAMAGSIGTTDDINRLSDGRQQRQVPALPSTAKVSSNTPSFYWVRMYERLMKRPAPQWYTLFAMEASRIRVFGPGADIRIQVVAGILTLASFIVGLLLNNPAGITYLPGGIVLVGGYFMVCLGWTGTQRYRGDYMKWYLAFPCNRVALLLSTCLAWITRVTALLVFMELALGIGMALHALAIPFPVHVYVLAGAAFLKSLIVFVALYPSYFLILQTAMYALRGPWSILAIPIYASIGFGGSWLFKVSAPLIFHNPSNWQVSNLWDLVLISIGVGIPLAVWFVTNGAAHLHMVLTRQNRLQGRNWIQ